MRLVTSLLKIERTQEGVRRIPINVRSLTGSVLGKEFESSLERDFILLTHWDDDVDWYQTQPVKINYHDSSNNPRHYTPDLLISYRKRKGFPLRKPMLCEVKYRADLAKDWKILKPKFKAARKFAKDNGYEFRIFTEREIRTAYLENIQFLWSYRFANFYQSHFEKLWRAIEELQESDLDSLLDHCYQTKTERGEALWTFWCMMARGWIKCDLTVPLNNKTRIWQGNE